MPSSYDSTKNPYKTFSSSPSSVAQKAVLITPSDAADLPLYVKALRIYVPTSIPEATVKVTPVASDDDADFVTIKVSAGVTYEPLSARKVFATGTTAGIEIHGYTA